MPSRAPFSPRTAGSPVRIEPSDRGRVLNALRARSELSDSGCWQWRGAKHEGTPYMELPGLAPFPSGRRAAWMLAHPGETLRRYAHVKPACGNRLCVNPDHMQLRNPGRARTGEGAAPVRVPMRRPLLVWLEVQEEGEPPRFEAELGGHAFTVARDGRCWRLWMDGKRRAPWDSAREAQDEATRLLEGRAA